MFNVHANVYHSVYVLFHPSLKHKLGTSGQNQFIEIRAHIVHQSIEH